MFVLGMPRSGTTLTEQIIASHPDVYGAGELHDLMSIAQQSTPAGTFRPYPENLAGLTRENADPMGRRICRAACAARAPDARHITDKMPANYLALGLIPLMLPNAKIIHVKRNPVDTCVSCFTRLFNRHQESTYDLAELGRHYANYARLMQHWRQVLPQGSFHRRAVRRYRRRHGRPGAPADRLLRAAMERRLPRFPQNQAQHPHRQRHAGAPADLHQLGGTLAAL